MAYEKHEKTAYQREQEERKNEGQDVSNFVDTMREDGSIWGKLLGGEK